MLSTHSTPRVLCLGAAFALLIGLAAPTLASPIGDTFDFAFSGFLSTEADGFVNQVGDPGQEGGSQGPFVFGTPGEFDFFGNTVVMNSTAVASGPGEETWTFSITATDGGELFDPVDPTGINFFGFRVLGIGAAQTSGGGATDPVFSATQDAVLDTWAREEGAIEVFGESGLLTTRNMFSRTETNGTRLHIGFSSAADSEIRLIDTLFNGGVGAVTELRMTYTTAVIPEPASVATALFAGFAALAVRRG